MTATTKPWAPFSERYGFRTHLWAWGREHSYARHGGDGYGMWGNCERDERRRCACPGSQRPACCATATQEDLLCDACRDHCVAVDEARVYYRFIDLYGPSVGQP